MSYNREYYLDTVTVREMGELVFGDIPNTQLLFRHPEELGLLLAPRLLGLKEAYPRGSEHDRDYQYLAIRAKLADRKPQIDVAVIQAVLETDLLTKYIQGNALTQKNLGETREGKETGASNTSYELRNTSHDYDMKRLAANLENSKNEVITLIASCFIDCLQKMVY